jgi:glycosyltransferase involved in cell wall biosynthesis
VVSLPVFFHRMKILFPYLARWRSANRSRYHQLLTHLCRLGHEVLVLQAPPMALDDISSRDFDLGRSEVEGLRVSELKASSVLRTFWETNVPRTKGLKKSLLAVSSIEEIKQTIEAERVDVLLLYNLAQSVLLERVGCHVHFDLADDLAEMMQLEHPLLSRFGAKAIALRSQRRLVARAHSVTVASSVLASRVERSALLLPNGADLSELDQAQGTEWRSRSDTPTIGFVGAFEYWVDFDLVLGLAARLPHLQFLLVGGGRRWNTIKDEIASNRLSNIHLTGPVPYQSAMNHAAAMDVCLLPFTHDPVSDGSCPLKLFEYAALRRPVVSTRITEVQSIGNGWIAFADDVDETAAAIERFLADKDFARRAGDDGRDVVEERYNWKLLASEFADYLTQSIPKQASLS